MMRISKYFLFAFMIFNMMVMLVLVLTMVQLFPAFVLGGFSLFLAFVIYQWRYTTYKDNKWAYIASFFCSAYVILAIFRYLGDAYLLVPYGYVMEKIVSSFILYITIYFLNRKKENCD